jgi:hypothetical protein
LPETFAVCRLSPATPIADWAVGPGLLSITYTRSELSVVVEQGRVPAGVTSQRGFRALGVVGPLEFGAVGVLASLAVPLAEASISIFVVSTYDTDYILVRQADLTRAIAALRSAGHTVHYEQ